MSLLESMAQKLNYRIISMDACIEHVLTPFKKVINNRQLLTFTGIENINFEKYTIDYVATQLGHINQEKKVSSIYENTSTTKT